MKQTIALLAAGVLILTAAPLWAASGDKMSFQAEPGTTESGYTIGADIYRIDAAGRLVEAANETAMSMVSLPLTSFTDEGSTISASPETATMISGPAARIVRVNGNTALRLSRNVGDDPNWIETTFRVPDNYYQNGDFRLKTVSAENGHAASLDFAVRVHTDSALDTSDSLETAVALAASASTATIAELELNPASDSFAQGNWVTIKVRRTAKVGRYAGDVDIYNFVFRYERQY